MKFGTNTSHACSCKSADSRIYYWNKIKMVHAHKQRNISNGSMPGFLKSILEKACMHLCA